VNTIFAHIIAFDTHKKRGAGAMNEMFIQRERTFVMVACRRREPGFAGKFGIIASLVAINIA
jgi:hypothetical protein